MFCYWRRIEMIFFRSVEAFRSCTFRRFSFMGSKDDLARWPSNQVDILLQWRFLDDLYKNVSYLNYNGILRGLLSLLPRTCESRHLTHASLKIATNFLPQKAFGSLKRVINRMQNIFGGGLGISEFLPIKWSAFFCRCQGRNILPSELCKWRCHQALKRQKMS